MTEPKKATGRAAKSTRSARSSDGLSEQERAAVKERAQELRSSSRGGSRADKAARDESALLAKIAEMPEPDRGMAERIHAVVRASAPSLVPKLWYGMPGYNTAEGKVVCFFQSAEKFKTRYATLGFNEDARLDDGTMWPTAFALTELTAANEAAIGALVRKAAGVSE